jgi:hypothetical protein
MKSYKELLGNDPLAEAILGVVNEDNTNDKSDDGEGLDKVQPKALKKKFKDRKDKDIDNDGDVDDSDKFIDKKRKAISKAIAANEDVDKADETPAGDDTEDEAPKKKKKKKDGEKDTPTTKDTGEEPIDVDPKLDEEAIKDGIFESLDMGHYIDQYGDRAIDVMESVTDKLFEKLTPDQKAKKDAHLKKSQGGRIHGDDPYHSTNRGRKTRDQRGDNDNTKGSDGDKMDDIDNAAKSNSEDELKKKMRNASGKGDHKKARKFNRALRMKKSGREGTSGRHGAGDANQA